MQYLDATYQAKWRGGLHALHQKYSVRKKIHDAIKQLMQTHTEADALDHLQKQLESVRTHTRDPNWKGFVALLDKERRAKEAQLQESAHLLDSGATRTVGGSSSDGGGSSKSKCDSE